jgi:hypothetical protein
VDDTEPEEGTVTLVRGKGLLVTVGVLGAGTEGAEIERLVAAGPPAGLIVLGAGREVGAAAVGGRLAATVDGAVCTDEGDRKAARLGVVRAAGAEETALAGAVWAAERPVEGRSAPHAAAVASAAMNPQNPINRNGCLNFFIVHTPFFRVLTGFSISQQAGQIRSLQMPCTLFQIKSVTCLFLFRNLGREFH